MERRLVSNAPAHEGEREEQYTDARHEHEAGNRPMRDVGDQQHVCDQDERREEVEDAVGEDGAEQRRRRALSPLHPPGEDGNPRELADPPRERGVPEQADRVRREDAPDRWPRNERLIDDRAPAQRARDDREKVEAERRGDPLPRDELERVPDRDPVRPPPPDEHDRKDDEDEHTNGADDPKPEAHLATAAGSRVRPSACS
jgi:hypothetical protein